MGSQVYAKTFDTIVLMRGLSIFLLSNKIPLVAAILVPTLYLISVFLFDVYNHLILAIPFLFFGFMVFIDAIFKVVIQSFIMHGVLLILIWSLSAYAIAYLLRRIFLKKMTWFRKALLVILLWLTTLAPWLLVTLDSNTGGCYENPPKSIHVITGKNFEPIGCGVYQGFGIRTVVNTK